MNDVNEQNRLRIERLTARYANRLQSRLPPDEDEFLRTFEDLCERVIRPPMDEISAELRRAGHAPRIVRAADPWMPGMELQLGLLHAAAGSNSIGFAVIRWVDYPLQILAYLEVNPPRFDLTRFPRPGEVRPEQIEQILVDAVEHVMTCNAP